MKDKTKGLDPLIAGNIVIGYDPEIHSKDKLEYDFRLPLGAAKRLIRSYYEELRMIDEEGVYLGQSSSSNLRMYPFASRMIHDIKYQLGKQGVSGKKVADEVFEMYFKKAYAKMALYSKNHKNQLPDSFQQCSDTSCCNYTNSFNYKARILLKLLKEVFINIQGSIPKGKRPYISWR